MGADGTDVEFIYETDEKKFELKTTEIKKQIGEIPINDPEVIGFIKNYLDENIENEF